MDLDSDFGGGATTPLYMSTFFLLIVFFTYFYVSITFNPD